MSGTRSSRIRLLVGVGVVLTLGVGGSACSSSSKTSTATTPPTRGLVGTSVPPGYVPAKKPVSPDAVAAITEYLKVHGPPIGTWVITSVEASTVDPTYVLYKISPAAGHEAQGATGYGFAQQRGTKWVALGFGTDAVGCPPGAPDNPVVPAKVLVGFSTTCAPAP